IKVAGRPAVAPAPAATPNPQAAAPKAPKPKVKAKPAASKGRPAAFVVAGAPKEPMDEMPLERRAQKLRRFVESHPNRTPARVAHFLYQHAWIVTGAKFGWFHGAEALEILVAVDRRAQRLWGIGSRSATVARAALAEVRAKQR
ncbi:MAG TPA: hypothetical protein VJ649_09065, partial [Actinomycetes bacterium]|nr:hypothetical protein [Actinomycetes bacterium]